MKKLIIGLLASVLMAAGFVGAATTSASAAQCDRYGVCIKPTANLDKDNTLNAGQKPKVKLKLGAPGDAPVEGTFKMIIQRLDGSNVFTSSKELNGNGAATITGPKLAPGKYEVTVKFIPDPNTPWERVTRTYYITVS